MDENEIEIIHNYFIDNKRLEYTIKIHKRDKGINISVIDHVRGWNEHILFCCTDLGKVIDVLTKIKDNIDKE